MATFSSPTDVTAGSLAKSTDLNNIDAAVAAAFALLPTNASINAGTVNYAADTGIADVYAVALQMTATSYTDGLVVAMKPLYANTGACTLNVDSLGAKSIKTEANGTPAAGDIVAGVPIELRYSSSTGYFHILKNSAAQATAAAASAAAALVSQNAASGSASSASGSASTATSQALAAGVSAVAALGSQNAAAGSAVAALGSQNAAAGSAVAALGSQNAAAGSAVAALASQGAAAGSAAAALISQNLAEAAWDNLDDRYLGAKSSDPTLDNDGNALITGAMYFNSVSFLMKVYSGTAWNVLGASEVAGDGIDVSFLAGQVTISVDLKANGGLVIEATELALDLGASSITGTLAVGNGGTGVSTLLDHGVLIGSGSSAITALTVGTNGQVIVGSTGADPVFATITDGEGIDTTGGAGTLTIACEDASTSNKGVLVTAGNSKALTGTDTASAMTPDDVKYVLGHDYTYPIQEVVDYSQAQNCPTALMDAFLTTPTSANLAAAVSDETGSGALVFATSPTLVTPTLGIASATSINKVAITAPASGSTLTIADGLTLTVTGQNATITGAGQANTITLNESITIGDGYSGTLTYSVSGKTLTVAADATISGSPYYPGGTDVPITDGGTGASDAATAFGNLKQAATDAATGVVELATNAESVTGTSTTLVITPDDLKFVLGHDYTYPIQEIVEYSTAQ